MPKFKSHLLVLGVCIITFSACKSKKTTTSQQGENTIGVVSYPLIGTHWVLIELNGKPISKDQGMNTVPYIEFEEDGIVAADDGCNRLYGPVEISEGNRIHFGMLASSMRACPGQTLEAPFRKMLETADNFSIQGSFLSLNKAKMSPLARFEAQVDTTGN